MEVKGATLLYTLAGLMVTFAGFSTLLLTLRPAAGAKLSLLDKFLARTVMTHIFVLIGGALLPAILALYDMPEVLIWRTASVLFALPMLFLLLTYPHRRRRVIGGWPPAPIMAIFVILAAVATLAMLGYILGGFEYTAGAYIAALTIDFFAVVFGFSVALGMIMEQPM